MLTVLPSNAWKTCFSWRLVWEPRSRTDWDRCSNLAAPLTTTSPNYTLCTLIFLSISGRTYSLDVCFFSPCTFEYMGKPFLPARLFQLSHSSPLRTARQGYVQWQTRCLTRGSSRTVGERARLRGTCGLNYYIAGRYCCSEVTGDTMLVGPT